MTLNGTKVTIKVNRHSRSLWDYTVLDTEGSKDRGPVIEHLPPRVCSGSRPEGDAKLGPELK